MNFCCNAGLCYGLHFSIYFFPLFNITDVQGLQGKGLQSKCVTASLLKEQSVHEENNGVYCCSGAKT
jgi:hypothetical protein